MMGPGQLIILTPFPRSFKFLKKIPNDLIPVQNLFILKEAKEGRKILKIHNLKIPIHFLNRSK